MDSDINKLSFATSNLTISVFKLLDIRPDSSLNHDQSQDCIERTHCGLSTAYHHSFMETKKLTALVRRA
jgi:hypothetical protein